MLIYGFYFAQHFGFKPYFTMQKTGQMSLVVHQGPKNLILMFDGCIFLGQIVSIGIFEGVDFSHDKIIVRAFRSNLGFSQFLITSYADFTNSQC